MSIDFSAFYRPTELDRILNDERSKELMTQEQLDKIQDIFYGYVVADEPLHHKPRKIVGIQVIPCKDINSTIVVVYYEDYNGNVNGDFLQRINVVPL